MFKKHKSDDKKPAEADESPVTASEAGDRYSVAMDLAHAKRADVSVNDAVDPAPVVVPRPPSKEEGAIGAAVALVAELRVRIQGGGSASHADVCKLESDIKALALL